MMRSAIILPFLLLIAACNNGGPNTRAINIKVEGAGGVTAYFDRFQNGLPFHVDSVKLGGDGSGTMHIPASPLDFYRIALGNEQLIVVLDSTDALNVEAMSGLLSTPIKAEGSKNTDLFRHFQEEAQGFDSKTAALRAALASDPNNTANIDELNATNQAFYERCKQFASENSGSPAAIGALGRLDIAQEFELFKQVREGLRKSTPRSAFFN
ncbi:MAG TPA: hypothetical protein PK760_03820, partial [Flavobacteriales bacterium]|nr:hypothetical protein [Flavobacteriales bacterium]